MNPTQTEGSASIGDASSGRIFDVEELYERGPGELAAIYGGRCWHTTPAAAGGVTEIVPFVSAMFVPSKRGTDVGSDVDTWLRRFCDGEFTSGRISNERSEEWSLNLVRTALSSVLPPFAMAIGPDNESVMEHEWDCLWTHPQGHPWSAGVHELVQKDLDRFINSIGWDQIDPRLLEAHTMRGYHGVQASAARVLITGVASIIGSNYDAEFAGVIRDGGGQLALVRLVGRLARFGDREDVAAMVQGPALMAFRHAVESAIGTAARYWADAPHDLTDSTIDELAGVEIGERGVAEITAQMRRFKAAAHGLADPSVLGTAIAAAADASSHGMEDDMALVFEAMEHLNDVDEEP